MTKAILCENEDGGVAITVVEERTINTPIGLVSITLDSELKRMKELNPEKTYTIVEKSEVDAKYAVSPFRNAWKTDLSTDLPKAKEIAHEMRRAKRDAAFKAVDGGSPYVAVDSVGQAKRDAIKAPDDAMQLEIDNAVTEEDLRGVLIAYLES